MVKDGPPRHARIFIRHSPFAIEELSLGSTPGMISTTAVAGTTVVPWWREVTRDQWRAFFAVFLGWVVDSFDFNVLAFILIDIQKEFSVDRAAAGALGTVTLMMRLVGGTIA